MIKHTHKTLLLVLLVFWSLTSSATSVVTSEMPITPEHAEQIGFHRLIVEGRDTGNDSWIIFVYPAVDARGHRVSEVCMILFESSEQLASSCVAIKPAEIKGFNRVDIEVSKLKDISVDLSISYGDVSYRVKDVVSMTGNDYESFKKRFNK